MAARRPDPRQPPRAKKQTLADALASQPETVFPGQRPAHDPWLDTLMQGGIDFWRARNVQMPDRVQFDVAGDLNGTDGERVVGRGWTPAQGGARIALNGDLVGRTLAYARDRKRPVRDRRDIMRPLMALIYHEIGHAGGLDHTPDGLMGPVREGVTPGDGVSLIRQLIPRERRG